MKHILIKATAIATAVLLPAAVQAATATANNTMGVSATVTRTCTVTTNPLAFGTVAGGAATTTTAGVSISCTAGSSTDAPTITVSDGANRAAAGLRRMVGGDSTTAYIPYTISGTSGGADLVAATTVPLTTADSGISYSATLYGSIASSTSYQKGTFNDTVTVTVTYAD